MTEFILPAELSPEMTEKVKWNAVKAFEVCGCSGVSRVDFLIVDDIPYILELNARFGGGYPFSHMGGCDLPRAIVEWVSGREVDVPSKEYPASGKSPIAPFRLRTLNICFTQTISG